MIIALAPSNRVTSIIKVNQKNFSMDLINETRQKNKKLIIGSNAVIYLRINFTAEIKLDLKEQC